jgi:CheY-like chemotaxis protein
MEPRGKILAIDDDADMRVLIKEALKNERYDVHTVGSAPEGIESLRQESFDLVILDIKMPEMDGIEALRKIIQEQRDLPVVLHSSYEHDKNNYLTWVAADYVVKTGDFTELKAVLARNLATN